MKGKDFHQGKPIRDQVRQPKRLYLSLNYEPRSQGEDLPGYSLQAWISPSENPDPRENRVLLGRADPKETRQTRVDKRSSL